MNIFKKFFGQSEDVINEDLTYLEYETFSLNIDDVFALQGKDFQNCVVVVGMVTSGLAKKGEVAILSDGSVQTKVIIKDIEQFRKKLNVAKKGEHVGMVITPESESITLGKENVHKNNRIFIYR